jgi:hypothetical protein
MLLSLLTETEAFETSVSIKDLETISISEIAHFQVNPFSSYS